MTAGVFNLVSQFQIPVHEDIKLIKSVTRALSMCDTESDPCWG